MAVQQDLFAPDALPAAAGPAGLWLAEEAVSPAEEAVLAGRIDAAPLEPFRFGQWRGKRLTTSYGSAYDFERGQVAEAPPLPGWLLDLRERLAALAGMEARAFGQALLIRYDPGAGIGWHRDRPAFGHVVGVSLGAPATMRFRRRRVEGGGRFERRHLPLTPRGAYHLDGEARHEWEHSIAPIEAARWSVTFRSLAGRTRRRLPVPLGDGAE